MIRISSVGLKQQQTGFKRLVAIKVLATPLYQAALSELL
jgi:hypothetical protein